MTNETLEMLHRAAVRFLAEAITAFDRDRKDIVAFRVKRVQAIIGEIRALPTTPCPELDQQLDALYVFLIDQLSIALAAETVAPIDVCRNILDDLHGAYQ